MQKASGWLISLVWVSLSVVLTAIPAPLTTTTDASRRHGFFPNPQTDLVECGSRTGRPSWVCDTSRELTQDTIDEADAMIRTIRNQSTCPCAQTSCRDAFKGGYKIGVAVVESLTSSNGNNNSEVLGKAISNSIRLSQWKLGACEEDIIIVMCIADRRIYMSVGDEAQKAFVYQCELETGHKFKSLVGQTDIGNFDRGLLLTLRDIRASLLDHRKCERHMSLIRWWHLVILGSCIFIVIIVIMGVVIKVRRGPQPTT